MKKIVSLFASACVMLTVAHAQNAAIVTAGASTYPGMTSGEFTSVASHPSGNFVVAGSMFLGAGAHRERGLVRMLRPDGSIVWEKVIVGDAAAPGVGADRVRVLGDGSVVVSCSGQSLAGVRFNGTTGAVIRSFRRNRPTQVSAIGPDGSMYWLTNYIDQTNPDTYSIGFNQYTGTRSRRNWTVSKLFLNGLDATATDYTYEYSYTGINLNTGLSAGDPREVTFDHVSKFVFHGPYVVALNTHRLTRDEVTQVVNGPVTAMFGTNPNGSYAYFNYVPWTDQFGDTDVLLEYGVYRDGNNIGLNLQRTNTTSGTTNMTWHWSIGTGVINGTAPSSNMTDRTVQVGGFTFRTNENNFLPGNARLGKYDAANNLLYSYIGNAIARDATSFIRLNSADPLVVNFGRYSQALGTFIDQETMFPGVGVDRINDMAIDQLNRGDTITVGHTVIGASNYPYVLGVNLAPIAKSDSFTMLRNTTLNGATATNDQHVGVNAYTLHSGPTTGVLNFFFTDGTFSYTPPVGFTGPVTFKYKITKAGLTPKVATVTINVT